VPGILRKIVLRQGLTSVVVAAVSLCSDLLGPGTADAHELSRAELAHLSSSVILGTVESSNARWDAATSMVFTDTVIRVERAISGRPEPAVTITEPGGTMPAMNIVMTVEHFPRFSVGERAIVMIWDDPHGFRQVIGGADGKVPVTTDPATGREMAGGVELERFIAALAPGADR
jgi:hypothetical protein